MSSTLVGLLFSVISVVVVVVVVIDDAVVVVVVVVKTIRALAQSSSE